MTDSERQTSDSVPRHWDGDYVRALAAAVDFFKNPMVYPEAPLAEEHLSMARIAGLNLVEELRRLDEQKANSDATTASELVEIERYDMEVIELGQTRFRSARSEVKPTGCDDGEWVEWDDVKELITELRRLKEDRDSWRRVAEKLEGEKQDAWARIAELEAEVGFWLGEGREGHPDVIEYRKLASKRTRRTIQETERLKYLARQFKIQSELEPELRQRIAEVIAEQERLKKVNANAIESIKERNQVIKVLKAALKPLKGKIKHEGI